jgi:glyoxylase-like metal-dependent hydrolase (beta-lactamase superfamily II)
MSDTVTTIDLGFVNAYLLKAGDGFVLVDTGMPAHRRKLEAALEAAGCRKGALRLVVLTHADMDHAGNAAVMAAAWGAPLALHEADRAALEKGEAQRRQGRTRMAGLVTALMSSAGRRRASPRAKADLLLADGQPLTEYGLDARVLHVPGHTPGSIALLLADGDLIAGDMFSNRRSPGLSPFVWNFEAYRASLARLASMASGLRRVYPGHGKDFDGAAIRGMEL